MTLFRDRKDAGRQLAAKLERYRFAHPLVLGIPRGGVPVAAVVADALDAELGVVVARKLGAPWQPELAIGAVTADGSRYLDRWLAESTGARQSYIEEVTAREVAEARRREAAFNGHRSGDLQGRTVIVVDDGLATGATARAALRSMRNQGAAHVVLAVPVAPPESVASLSDEADEIVCVAVEQGFMAIGQFYVDFSPVADREVRELLAANRETPRGNRDATVVRDGVRLSVRLLTPDADGPFPVVVFVHGLGSDKDSPRNRVVAERLRDSGFATVLFDLSGHGESDIDPRGGVAYVDDLAAVWAWTAQQPEVDRRLMSLSGSSLGGVVALHAIEQGRVNPATMVLRAPPIEPGDLDRLRVPTLAIVGDRDPLLSGIRAAALRAPMVTLSVVPGASHLFEEPRALDRALERTEAWFRATAGRAFSSMSSSAGGGGGAG